MSSNAIEAVLARNYINNLSEEVKKGMRQKVLQGGWPHRPPRGYRYGTGQNWDQIEGDMQGRH